MLSAAAPPTEVDGRNACIGLKAYLDGIEAVVKRLPSAWVRCELHTLKVGDRFIRMEFIELDDSGKQIAKVQGGCWPAVWQRMATAFKAAGLPLEAGSQVLVKLEAHVNATFGFQVNVLDIDLTFALGDLNARIQAIKRHLREVGCWDSNRSLARPADFLRVAVISPPGAAGLGDFRSTADRLAGAGLAKFVYHDAPFQTREASARIVDILRGLYKECKVEETRHCAVAIIRGGGASADLAWLVDQKLAEAVCRMNVPVMTGIGHERDRNLLDEIACIPCDTPSKVAEHISTTITRAATAAQRAYEVIQAQITNTLDRHQAGLTNSQHSVDRYAQETVRLAEAAVRSSATGLEPGARKLLDDTQVAVALAVDEARSRARERREAAANAIQSLRVSVAAAVEATLRPLEFGAQRAKSEIATRLESLPLAALDNVRRLHDQIIGDVRLAADDCRSRITKLREQLLGDARRTTDECAAAIAMVQERADALHPRTVLAAGYAILRDSAGVPLTSAGTLREAGLVLAEMRDGTVNLHHIPDGQQAGGDDT